MTRRDKLVHRFLSKPKDFTWRELVALLEGLGYSKVVGGKSGGSRVRFVHPNHPPISLHRPHPRPVLKRYQLEQIEEVLRGEGLI
jgi:predicted RNA binding protein YcfA (HicA-like mRNA interferase family)